MPSQPTGNLFSKFLGTQSKNVVLLESILLVLFIGVFDYITPYQFSMAVFYTAPIFIAAWYADKKCADLTAIIALIITWWTDELTAPPEALGWIHDYRMAVRLFFFLAISIGASALRARRDLAVAQIELFERNQSLEREIIKISEREQHRIGQDLHDGLCQYLAAITCAATSLKNDLASHPAHESLKSENLAAAEIAELLKQGVSQARNISRGLFPVHTDESGLDAALQELAVHASRMLGIRCEFDSGAPVFVHDNEVAAHLYRIAQEAINNATRHGRATRVAIALAEKDGAVTLRIADNGAGLPSSAKKSTGMGLKIMGYRARFIGGDLQIADNPGGGVVITCTFRQQQESASQTEASGVTPALDPATLGAR